jgi:NAD(P)-dependent dehydrogenase (short-subunit alcohol dehydrogenase family)
MGKTALVTGGSRGIGRSTAERLGREGALVAVHYGSNAGAADDTVASIQAAGGSAFAIQSDLAADRGAEQLWSDFDKQVRSHAERPGLDILVNNAGITTYEAIEQVTEESYDRIFAINTRSPFFVVQRGLDRLRDGGRIINVTSSTSRTAVPDIIAYAMTKGALDAFTRTLAKQLGARGITVNGVSCAYVVTDMTAWLDNLPDVKRSVEETSVFGRGGQPGDIADVIGFLASDEARWVTAHIIDATGGTDL